MEYIDSADYKHTIECEVSMPDEICLNENNNNIEVVYSGVLTRQDMESTKAKIQQILAEKTIKRVFIDTTRLESGPSIFDIYEIIASLPLGFRIAILIAPSSPIIDEIAFAETVGLNRGVTIKAYLDRNDARQWLGTFED